MIADIKKSADEKMKKSLEALKADFGKVRTGRAHTGILDHVKVDYYGTLMPINQVANISVIDAHTLGVQPWEKPMVAKVEKAIRDADLGLNPAAMGDVIRVPMTPPHRGTPQGTGETGARRGREWQGGRTQHPAGRHRPPEGNGEEQGSLRGRGTPRPGRGAETHRQVHRRDRQGHGRQRKRPDGGLRKEFSHTPPLPS